MLEQDTSLFDNLQPMTCNFNRRTQVEQIAFQHGKEPRLSTEVIHTGPSLGEILLMDEVSELTRIPLSTLRFYRHSNQGPRSFKLGGRIAYKRADVLEWIETRYNNDTARRVAG